MRLTDLKPKAGSKHRKRRIGRGIAAGQGASGGFGMRGQKSRSGRPTRPGFEGGQMPLYRRLPKLKRFPLINPKKYTVINVCRLSELPANSEVTLNSLMQAGIVTTNDGPLKLLGDGELNVSLTCKASAFTRTAQAKIEAAGGSCEIVDNINSSNNFCSSVNITTPADKLSQQKPIANTENILNLNNIMAATITPESNNGYRNLILRRNTEKFILDPRKADQSEITIAAIDLKKASTQEEIALHYLDAAYKQFFDGLSKAEKYSLDNYSFRYVETISVPFSQNNFLRFCQYYFDFKIYNSLSTVELDKSSSLISIKSNIAQPSEIEIIQKRLQKEEITKKIKENQTWEMLYEDEDKKINLYLYNKYDSKWCLAYIVNELIEKNNYAESDNDDLDIPEIFDLVVEASTGEEIDRLYRTQ